MKCQSEACNTWEDVKLCEIQGGIASFTICLCFGCRAKLAKRYTVTLPDPNKKDEILKALGGK